jgi:hypothetical protein
MKQQKHCSIWIDKVLPKQSKYYTAWIPLQKSLKIRRLRFQNKLHFKKKLYVHSNSGFACRLPIYYETIMTKRHQSIPRKPCPITILSTINPTWTEILNYVALASLALFVIVYFMYWLIYFKKKRVLKYFEISTVTFNAF